MVAQVDFSWDCDSSFPDHHKIQALAEAMKSKEAEVSATRTLFDFDGGRP